MSATKQYTLKEHLVYLALWAIVFIAPLASLFVRSAYDVELAFRWDDVFRVWHLYLVYLAAFLLHNLFLAPLLVYRRKKMAYFAGIACLLAAFVFLQCQGRPADRDGRPPHEARMVEGREPGPPGEFTPMGQKADDAPRPPEPNERPGELPPMEIGLPHIFQLVVVVLMLGMNLGIKYYFKSQEDHRRLKELETRSLEGQLEYLRYQINPHFFMNTLNNIHALVDIAPEKAKECIIHLSKLMRYVLYESNRDYVPMTKEIEFMENYVRLMRIRYTDKLSFTVDMPDNGMGILIPPLLFISFVENAFKHGVSYRYPSFIRVDAKRYSTTDGEERMTWTCANSKHPQMGDVRSAMPKQGGVGLTNVRRRLEIIYGDNYSLDITDGETEFTVRMDLPLKIDKAAD